MCFGIVDVALKQLCWPMTRATLVEDRAQAMLVQDMARASRNKSFGSSIPHSFLGTVPVGTYHHIIPKLISLSTQRLDNKNLGSLT